MQRPSTSSHPVVAVEVEASPQLCRNVKGSGAFVSRASRSDEPSLIHRGAE